MHCSIQALSQPDPGPASKLCVPQAEIKAIFLANTAGPRHCLPPASAEQKQPQHALSNFGKR